MKLLDFNSFVNEAKLEPGQTPTPYVAPTMEEIIKKNIIFVKQYMADHFTNPGMEEFGGIRMDRIESATKKDGAWYEAKQRLKEIRAEEKNLKKLLPYIAANIIEDHSNKRVNTVEHLDIKMLDRRDVEDIIEYIKEKHLTFDSINGKCLVEYDTGARGLGARSRDFLVSPHSAEKVLADQMHLGQFNPS